MRATRAFRTIGRINSVLFLGGVLVVLGLAAAASLSSLTRGDHTPRRAAAVVDAPGGERLYLGTVQEVGGTPYVILPLETHTPGAKLSSGSSYESGTRNLLFYDASNGTARWLRPDNRGLVVRHQFVRESGAVQESWNSPETGKDPVRWVRYELAVNDTDKDGMTTLSDTRQLAVSGPRGDDLTVVLDELEEVLGYAPVREGLMTVFFRRAQGEFVGIVDLASRKLQSEAPLPKP